MRELSPAVTFVCPDCYIRHRLFPVSSRGYTLHCTCSREYKLALSYIQGSQVVAWWYVPKSWDDQLPFHFNFREDGLPWKGDPRQRGFGGGAPIRGEIREKRKESEKC